MARSLNMDTLQQNFWKEEYLKEIMLRFGWHQKYGALVKAKQERHRERHKKAMETTLKLPSLKAPPPGKPGSPPLPPPPAVPPKERDLMGVDAMVLQAEMKPPLREVRALLYQGISHEDEGRYRYLQTRMLLRPEDKYTFPITTNFNYGWQMGNMATSYVAPTPKCRIDSFFRKNGAFSLLHPRDVAL
ncbi:protein ATP6V1FNB [Eublepharis macularius]|uniref:Protein ATP6V1FNB n=1 Tax=Eublepharis macularius TaxID=481883 RepID=A0AA97JRJ5_EUBMA|nr:protein ATP6V1FNB [Eublepharis macularius]